jgi:hypothetical protein
VPSSIEASQAIAMAAATVAFRSVQTSGLIQLRYWFSSVDRPGHACRVGESPQPCNTGLQSGRAARKCSDLGGNSRSGAEEECGIVRGWMTLNS